MIEAALVDAGRPPGISSTPTAVQPQAYMRVLAPKCNFWAQSKNRMSEYNDLQTPQTPKKARFHRI